MGLALVVVWAILTVPATIAFALSPSQGLLLIFAGIAVALALRRPIELGARRWRERRIALEERHPRFPSRA
jgi:chromate transport protein ChrA